MRLSIRTRQDILEASDKEKIDAKVWVNKAIKDFIDNADIENLVKKNIPVTREGEMFPRVTYKIDCDVHQQLGQLARELTRKSGRKYTLGMLATYAVEEALKSRFKS